MNGNQMRSSACWHEELLQFWRRLWMKYGAAYDQTVTYQGVTVLVWFPAVNNQDVKPSRSNTVDMDGSLPEITPKHVS